MDTQEGFFFCETKFYFANLVRLISLIKEINNYQIWENANGVKKIIPDDVKYANLENIQIVVEKENTMRNKILFQIQKSDHYFFPLLAL